MKVILLQDVKGIGKRGTIKEVSDGYARNSLLPKKLAEIATPGSARRVEEIQKKQAETEKMLLGKQQEAAKNLNGQEIVISAKEKNGKLFGSIHAKDIAGRLKEDGFSIEEKQIILPNQIKELGEYKVELNFGHNIKSSIIVSVRGI